MSSVMPLPSLPKVPSLASFPIFPPSSPPSHSPSPPNFSLYRQHRLGSAPSHLPRALPQRLLVCELGFERIKALSDARNSPFDVPAKAIRTRASSTKREERRDCIVASSVAFKAGGNYGKLRGLRAYLLMTSTSTLTFPPSFFEGMITCFWV